MRFGVSVELPLTLANVERIKQLLEFAKTQELGKTTISFCGRKSEHRGAEDIEAEERNCWYDYESYPEEVDSVVEKEKEYKTDEQVQEVSPFSAIILPHVIRYMRTQGEPEEVEVLICNHVAVEAYCRNISRRTSHHRSVFTRLDLGARSLGDMMERLEGKFVEMGFRRDDIVVSYDFEDSA